MNDNSAFKLPAIEEASQKERDGKQGEISLEDGKGSTSLYDELGPLVINSDGTASRITNWREMTETEKKNILRVLGKRNNTRIEALNNQDTLKDLRSCYFRNCFRRVFNEMISLPNADQQSEICLSANGKDILVYGRNGLWIVDLESGVNRRIRLRPKLPSETDRLCVKADWNKFRERQELVAYSHGRQFFILNLDMPDRFMAVESVEAHRRSITDIKWSHFHPSQLYTSSIDMYIHHWDLRDTRRPSSRFCSWSQPLTRLDLNHQNENLLATLGETLAFIWDKRNYNSPLACFKTDSVDEFSMLQWSRSSADTILLASQTGKVSIRNVVDPSQLPIYLEFPEETKVEFTYIENGIMVANAEEIKFSHYGNFDHYFYSIPLSHPVLNFQWRPLKSNLLESSEGPCDFELVTWCENKSILVHRFDETFFQALDFQRYQRLENESRIKSNTYALCKDEGSDTRISRFCLQEVWSEKEATKSSIEYQYESLEIKSEDESLEDSDNDLGISIPLEIIEMNEKYLVPSARTSSGLFSGQRLVVFQNLAPLKQRSTSSARPGLQILSPKQATISLARRITIRDLVNLLPFSRSLAEEYRVHTTSAHYDSCEHNSKIAQRLGIKEEQNAWTLLDLLLRNQQQSNVNLKRPIRTCRSRQPQRVQEETLQWGTSPVFKNTVNGLLSHFQDQHNIMMTTLISCALEHMSERSSTTSSNVPTPDFLELFKGPQPDTRRQNLPGTSIRKNSFLHSPKSIVMKNIQLPPPQIVDVQEKPVNTTVSQLLSFHPRSGANSITNDTSQPSSKYSSPELKPFSELLQTTSQESSRTAYSSPQSNGSRGRRVSMTQNSPSSTLLMRPAIVKRKFITRTSPKSIYSIDALFDDLVNPPPIDNDKLFAINQQKRMYFELLHQWRLLGKAAEVGKHLQLEEYFPPKKKDNVQKCEICKGRVKNNFCLKCAKFMAICVICDLPIKTMSKLCRRCGHGGHPKCIVDWFNNDQGNMNECATGCGCFCK